MMRVRIGEFVAAVCVVAWGVAQVWAAPRSFRVDVLGCVYVVGGLLMWWWTQAAVSCVGFRSGWFPSNVARNSRAHISDIEM